MTMPERSDSEALAAIKELGNAMLRELPVLQELTTQVARLIVRDLTMRSKDRLGTMEQLHVEGYMINITANPDQNSLTSIASPWAVLSNANTPPDLVTCARFVLDVRSGLLEKIAGTLEGHHRGTLENIEMLRRVAAAFAMQQAGVKIEVIVTKPFGAKP